jgi:DNA polymerase-3 subunit gamma/tau
MSYQVLARKWRPKHFEEVIGQEHVTRSLQNALRSKKLAHAYLFTGTRGVGKTSIARLFAKSVRCENRGPDMNPCGECQSCKDIEQSNSLDYQEIDGASHNGVDNVRELIENVRYLPSRGEYKLYVIDEVHMLSTPAFNALLKTLEEPPAHVIFVFATTDPHKLLGTVLSRCQRFDFKNVLENVLEAHIVKVTKAEGIKFNDPKLIGKLAEYGKGSVRDTLSLLDQVLSLSGHQEINERSFYQALGLARSGAVSELISFILKENPTAASEIFKSILNENIDLKKLIDQVMDNFYQVIQKIDSPEHCYTEGLLKDQALKGITYAELFWIYETFSKDAVWALQTAQSEKVIDVVIQKLARRRQILKPDHAQIKHGHKTTQAAPSVEPKKELRKIISNKLEDFTNSLLNAPTIRANLELGDYVRAPQFVDDKLVIEVGYVEDEMMPADYLKDPEVMAKLKLLLANFYEVSIEQIQVRFSTLTQDEAKKTGFISISDRHEKKSKDEVEQRRNLILNDPYVKEAEKLFNAKVDKVILKE